jgi:hypothetical protein
VCVDGPYNKDPTVKTLGSRGVYNRFHAFFDTNKVPRGMLQFLWIGTHLGGKGTNVPHVLGTAAPPGMAGLAGAAGLARAAGPAGAASPVKCGRTCPLPRPQSRTLSSPRAQLG